MSETTRSDATEIQTPETHPSSSKTPSDDSAASAADAVPSTADVSGADADAPLVAEQAVDAPAVVADSARAVPAEGEEEPDEDPLPQTFAELGLPEKLLSALDKMGWTKPTPVQCKAYGPLVEGEDLLVQSHTGSGKTGAFCLPWLAKFEPGDAKKTGVQLIVILPTRELAKQVCVELTRLAGDTEVKVLPVYGGTPMVPQLEDLKAGVHAVVGTPGRVLDHIRRRTLDLSNVKLAVLDECDEMLSMGFLEDIRSILQACPKERQTCLFSATVPRDIARIAERYMRSPVEIALSTDHISAAEIDHAYYVSDSPVKTRDLLDMLMVEQPGFSIVFCNTREETRFVAGVLRREGYDAEDLSSDLTQAKREHVLQRMRDHKLHFLVATDIAARGIDISHVSHVINYSFPDQAESYVHRTGRTGRAGRAGLALSLIGASEIGNFHLLKKIYKSLNFVERKLPRQEELNARRIETKIDAITQRLSQPVSPEWTLLARHLVKDPRGEAILAYLLSKEASPERPQARRTTAEEEVGEPREARYRDRSSHEGRGRERERGRGRDRGGREGRSRDRDRAPREAHEHSERAPTQGRRRTRNRDEDVKRPESPAIEAQAAEPDVAPAQAASNEQSTNEAVATKLNAAGQDSAKSDEPKSETLSEAAPADALETKDGTDQELTQRAESEEDGRKRRRRRRRRGGRDEERQHDGAQAETQAKADQADGTSPGSGEDGSSDAEAKGEEGDAKKRRRRRGRRRGKRGGEAESQEGTSETETEAGAETEAEGDGTKKRRRRRRGRKKPEEAANGAASGAANGTPPEPAVVAGGEAPKNLVDQSEIVIDIDEAELEEVRAQFGDVDEFSDLTLSAKRRDVMDDLRVEMVIEDVSAEDEEDAEDAEDAEDVEEEEGTTADAASAEPASQTVSSDDSPADLSEPNEAEHSTDDADAETTAEPQKKRRRRRRRKKKEAPPAAPELTAPPHKDFWEVWSSKYTIEDFGLAAAADDAALEEEEDRKKEEVAVTAQDANAEDADFVRVRLNIGRTHGQKSADIRAILRDRASLSGRAVRDLTVGTASTLLRINATRLEALQASVRGFEVADMLLEVTLVEHDEAASDAPTAEPSAAVESVEEATPSETPEASAEPTQAAHEEEEGEAASEAPHAEDESQEEE